MEISVWRLSALLPVTLARRPLAAVLVALVAPGPVLAEAAQVLGHVVARRVVLLPEQGAVGGLVALDGPGNVDDLRLVALPVVLQGRHQLLAVGHGVGGLRVGSGAAGGAAVLRGPAGGLVGGHENVSFRLLRRLRDGALRARCCQGQRGNRAREYRELP
ncbi:hypothetical protein AAHB37_16355 [Glutamicibacter halophytocola]|uniref:hypothetical protein n=1 Tax=Glutamicibacter halophytocola TaxID=1933880 RepID=UPI003219D53A